MARYTGSVCRLCRREGEKLYLKGERCYTNKCAVDRRTYAPGQHGQARKKTSEYSGQLREKQKLRRIYGVLEAQFENYFVMAKRRKGIAGENLMQILESRLDNVVYRAGLARSRAEARQLVRHGHFTVNGRKTNIPSALLRAGDVVGIREESRKAPRIQQMIQDAGVRKTPEWLDLNTQTMEIHVVNLPERAQIDVAVKEHLIVEFYA